jgi:hypothetical protein
LTGIERGVFIANPDGSPHIGQVWPGYTVRAPAASRCAPF